MITRIGSQGGKSFKGAAGYYLHDKGAATSHRVEFTQTLNMATDDPEQAWRFMAWTASMADELKRQEGGSRSGPKAVNTVFTLSLSAHPEQDPDREEQIAAMKSALAELKLQDHQALLVAHNDEPHAHIHAIVNLIHPVTGRSHAPAFSKERLSEWAEKYEREHGKIYCHERVKNNAQRRQHRQERAAEREAGKPKQKARYTRHKEPELDLKAAITRIYHSSDNARAFQAGLREMGLEIKQGRKIVIIDRQGKTHSLSRQIEGVRAKDLRAKLAGLELENIDRREAPEADEDRRKEANKLRDYLATNRAGRDRLTQRLAEIDKTIETEYGENERALRADLAKLEAKQNRAGFLSRITGSRQRRADEIERKRASLASIEQRKEEMRGRTARSLDTAREKEAGLLEEIKAIEADRTRAHEQERQRLQTIIPDTGSDAGDDDVDLSAWRPPATPEQIRKMTPDEKKAELARREAAYERQSKRDRQRERTHDHDRDSGPEREL